MKKSLIKVSVAAALLGIAISAFAIIVAFANVVSFALSFFALGKLATFSLALVSFVTVGLDLAVWYEANALAVLAKIVPDSFRAVDAPRFVARPFSVIGRIIKEFK